MKMIVSDNEIITSFNYLNQFNIHDRREERKSEVFSVFGGRQVFGFFLDLLRLGQDLFGQKVLHVVVVDVVEVFVAFDDDGVAAGVRRASVIRRQSHVDVNVGVGVASPDVAV